MASLLQPPRTCQRVDTAQRAALLLGTDSYFDALRSGILAARHSVLILGWHVDAEVALGSPLARPRAGFDTVPVAPDGFPVRLRDLLVAALDQRSELRVFISTWDFSVVHPLPRAQLARSGFEEAHPRLSYRVDAQHASSAAHHEKLVVIDDWLAFVGSADLSTRAWPAGDTAESGSDRRSGKQVDTSPAAPAHTSQLCLQGPAARALSVLARERALPPGEQLALAPEAGDTLWPTNLTSELGDVPAAIARTRAATLEQGDVREALAMTLAAIGAARQYLYIESQYFGSRELVDALCDRLREADGPEVVLLLPHDREAGWLGHEGMTSLRRAALQLLHSNDVAGRLGVYQPPLGPSPQLDPHATKMSLELNSRLILVDGCLLKVGSSNLNNRSMSLDTECDVWLEAQVESHRSGVQHMLHRLLAVHLGVSSDEVAMTLRESGSLIATIERLRGRRRFLEPVLPDSQTPRPSLSALALALERPSAAEAFVRFFAPSLPAQRVHHRALLVSALGVALLGFVLLMVLVSNPQSAIRTMLTALLERVRDPQVGLLYVLLAYALGTLVCAPITALFAATALVLSPLRGFAYAMLGGLFGATLSFFIGRIFGSGPLQRVQGARLTRLRREVQTNSFRSVLIARFLPVGNFTLINVFLGSLKVPYLAFISGTGLGMLPGVLGLTLLSGQLQEAWHSPSLASIGRLLLIGLGFLLLMFALSRFFSRRKQRALAEAEAAPAEEGVMP